MLEELKSSASKIPKENITEVVIAGSSYFLQGGGDKEKS